MSYEILLWATGSPVRLLGREAALNVPFVGFGLLKVSFEKKKNNDDAIVAVSER